MPKHLFFVGSLCRGAGAWGTQLCVFKACHPHDGFAAAVVVMSYERFIAVLHGTAA